MHNEHNWSYTYRRWPKIIFRFLCQIYFEKDWVQAIFLFRLRFIFGFAQRWGPCRSLACHFSKTIQSYQWPGKGRWGQASTYPWHLPRRSTSQRVMSVRVTVSRVSWCSSGLISNRFPPPVPTGVSPGPTARQSASSCCHVAKDSRSKL